ncbi:MAG: phosphomannomutase/phosphoglucomutase [Phycisphaerae bacterium]|nr:phosphomannomutase/phosphoglucomutase [Phycisphaerae bacterium]
MHAAQTTADYYKFCPGEEHVKISNAICRGRRRTHYPACQGCRFNDDEKPPQANLPVTERADPVSQIASAFQPHGVCAPVPVPLSQDVAWRIGYATAQFLRGRLRGYDRADPSARSFIVGRDTRIHSAGLQRALIEGIRAAGLDAVNIGAVDTPQLYFAVNHVGASGGIQTTGGTMPADYNGFVICGGKAVPVTAETGLASIRDIALRVPKHQTGTTARLTDQDFSKPYTDFIRGFLRGGRKLAKPLKVVVDASNGMASRWVSALLKRIKNVTVVPLNCDGDGHFEHEPDPLNVKNTRQLRKSVKDHKADFGVCFGGDAANCAFADEKGFTVRPDLIAALLARMFIERQAGAAIVLDHRSTRTASEEIRRAGGVSVLSRADQASMKKLMSERNAVFGGALDGRFYFRDNFFCESAILAFVHVLNLLASADRKLSELVRPLYRYRSSGEVRFPCPDPDKVLHEIASAHGDAEIDTLDGITASYPDWWFNARPSPAGPVLLVTLEARTRKALDEKLTQLQPLLGDRS